MIEVCPLAAHVYELAQSMNIDIQVVDTTQDAWKWKNVKRKTDRDDALKLARLSALGQLNLVHMPSLGVRQRQTLVAERTRCKNRNRDVLLQEERTWPLGKCVWTVRAMKDLNQTGQPLSDRSIDELWRGALHIELQRLDELTCLLQTVEVKLDEFAHHDWHTQLLESIPGVNPRTVQSS